MNLIDCLFDDFSDEGKIAQLEEREIITWIEVCCMI
jgi:dynein heavy chain